MTMTAQKQISLVITIILTAICSIASAGSWSEPVMLEELNDSVINQPAFAPHLSADGLTMYFNRDIGNSRRLWEAYRDTPDGPFTDEREISELYNPGKNIYFPWVSDDGLRMYYGRYESSTRNQMIRMAERSSTDDLWQDVVGFSTLDAYKAADSGPSLTADELTIFFLRAPASSNTAGIWTATRSSIYGEFLDPVPVTELNIAPKCTLPCISPDGLTIYYSVWLEDRLDFDVYTATRSSTDEPFSDIRPVEGISTAGNNETDSYVTPDGQTFYFARRDQGIFVSHWILTPEEVAIGKIRAAIAEKEEIIAAIDEAIAKETEALRALSELDANGRSKGYRRHFVLARIKIVHAIRKQLTAKSELQKSIADLQESIDHIVELQQLDLQPEPENTPATSSATKGALRGWRPRKKPAH